MDRSISPTQTKNLGERLRKSETPSEDDVRLLQQVLSDCAEPMARVQQVLAEHLGLHSTARLKTSGTIIDKLKRDKTRVHKMQDLAGARVVKDMGLIYQDRVVSRIVNAFPGAERDDLRDSPRHGYRAVHVIVPIETFSVEIQVRTEMQDLWANLIESFEGEMGRGIRYGRKPRHPRRRVRGLVIGEPGTKPTQTQTLAVLSNLSTLVKSLEDGKKLAGQRDFKRLDPSLKTDIAVTEERVKSLFRDVIQARRGRGR